MWYSVTLQVRGSSLPMYPLKFAVNQMFPCESATRPCGPESAVSSGNSLICPVLGSSLPSLFAICPVYQREPSGATAGASGREFGVGRSNSLMEIFGAGALRLKVIANITDAQIRVRCLRMSDYLLFLTSKTLRRAAGSR